MVRGYFHHFSTPITEATVAALQKGASGQRQERAARYKKHSDQARCLVAGRLIERALSDARCSDYLDKIHSLPQGKPVLPPEAKLAFNLSHAGDWVACVAADSAIGIDIEAIADGNSYDLSTLFTDSEIAFIDSSNDQKQRQQRFYRLWTLKESYVKAIGTGLYTLPNAFEITVIDDSLAYTEQAGNRWFFYSFMPDNKHICSICSRKRIDRKHLKLFSNSPLTTHPKVLTNPAREPVSRFIQHHTAAGRSSRNQAMTSLDKFSKAF